MEDDGNEQTQAKQLEAVTSSMGSRVWLEEWLKEWFEKGASTDLLIRHNHSVELCRRQSCVSGSGKMGRGVEQVSYNHA